MCNKWYTNSDMMIFGVIRFLIIDFVWNVLYFPVWWYTTGLAHVGRLVVRQVHGLAQALNLRILFQFLFKPMFGQYDIWGRIISFYVRIVHFVVLLIFTLVSTILLSLLCLLWVLLPLVVIWSILYHLEFSTTLANWYEALFTSL